MSRILPALLLVLLAASCATLPEDIPPGDPGYALAPAASGPLADLEARFLTAAGPEVSGFKLLDANAEALRWRLALIDSARFSLDLQYYVWWGDESGSLLMQRLAAAADRGVKVRIIVDDLATMLQGANDSRLRGSAAAVIDLHPSIDVRLFNPWRSRSLAGRFFEYVSEFELTNQRMHNKLMIADNRVAIIGGRNIGNEYFGLSSEVNFRDLDTLGVGPVARQASAAFDRFWNSDIVVPAGVLWAGVTPADLQAGTETVHRRLGSASVLTNFSIDPLDWSADLAGLSEELHTGTSYVPSDTVDEDGVNHLMPAAIRNLLETAEREVLISNAYLIPDDEVVAWIQEQIDRGVRYRILTNSLASNDVTAVNAHYKHWRGPLLGIGAELYETRPEAAVKSTLADTPPVEAAFMGLHAKAVVVDGLRVFIGSMNFDPRSWRINSEVGVIVESPGLAAAMKAAIEADMRPENAWKVTLGPDGEVLWVAGDEVLDRQPARSFWQRVQDVVLMVFPKEIY
ncbi:MAG: phospholipase D family protein [Kiloniellaceae bacterium]